MLQCAHLERDLQALDFRVSTRFQLSFEHFGIEQKSLGQRRLY